jgi:hypothetical protein
MHMAVDFSLLPPEETLRIDPPSRLVWTVAFFVIAIACVFGVLLIWPKDMPTHTWKFWTSLVLFPLGIPAVIVLRRYSFYDGRKLDVELPNEAARDFNERVFTAASIPMALLGAAHRFSDDAKTNNADAIRRGEIILVPQEPIAADNEPVKSRWLVVPGMRTTAGTPADDCDRRRRVTAWLFEQLLDDLLPCIQPLDAQLPVTIHLNIDNGFTYQENVQLWMKHWHARQLKPADIEAESSANLMALDAWLDKALEGLELHVKLFISIQLYPLLAGTPPDGTAEAGVAVMLAPESVAQRYETRHIANVHRPVQGLIAQPTDVLSHAMRWAGAKAKYITGRWQTGIDMAQTGALGEPARKLDLTAHPTDLDLTVGFAGIAAPWLALSCAASSLTDEANTQIVVVGHEKHIQCTVLKSTSDEPTSGSSRA